MAEIINGNMAEQVKTLYENVCKTLTIQCKINKLAMRSLQALGYNGFKRWHRYRAGQFFAMKIALSNEIFDKFGIKMDFRHYDTSYDPASMEEHLKSWSKAIMSAFQDLGNANKKYFELVGVENETIRCAIHKLSRDYEKIKRLIMRFTESDWLTLDMHIVDDKLHCKYKEKEEKYGFKYR